MKISVVVVESSLLFRSKLKVELEADREIEVISSFADTRSKVSFVADLKPDVIILEVSSHDASGLKAISEVMSECPTPIIVLTNNPKVGTEALKVGALCYLEKPFEHTEKQFYQKLRTEVKAVSKIVVQKITYEKEKPTKVLTKKLLNKDTVIAIGASTGGTDAIVEVVEHLPENMPGIIIVQHMPSKFTAMYAERLERICKMTVSEAKNGERLTQGKIILAAGDYHLTLCKDADGYYVRSRQGERVSGHCPSVDVMFESVANVAGRSAIGVILTGMGADGARGLKMMHDKGAYTIGQDKESCIVYGMPMEAFKLGAVKKQLPLDQIADELIRRV